MDVLNLGRDFYLFCFLIVLDRRNDYVGQRQILLYQSKKKLGGVKDLPLVALKRNAVA